MSGKEPPNSGNPFTDTIGIVKMLRSPGGCPWDMKQTIESAVGDLLDEADEVREALEMGDMKNLREELGDLFWSIAFTANIARERNLFDMDDILKEVNNKMIRRHPHVFGDAVANSPDDAMRYFQEAKEREKNEIHKG